MKNTPFTFPPLDALLVILKGEALKACKERALLSVSACD